MFTFTLHFTSDDWLFFIRIDSYMESGSLKLHAANKKGAVEVELIFEEPYD